MNDFQNQPLPPVFYQNAGIAIRQLLSNEGGRFSGIFVLADENTHRHCLPYLRQVVESGFHSIVIGSGEQHKTINTCGYVWKQLLEHGADRSSLLINLGGGMVTDLGGFAASTFMRGIRFVHIPTSLLGMVDASVGGKCGVDLDGFKNTVGTFAYPQAVIIDKEFLKTLPEHEFRNGMIEVFKHGLIADENLWNRLFSIINDLGQLPWGVSMMSDLHEIIPEAIAIKSSIVLADPLEQKERKFLNFGHTVGHAIETYSLRHDPYPVSHGEAVAAGMVCEAFLSTKLCGLSSNALTDIKSVMKLAFPKMHLKHEAFSEMIHLMKSDKKSESGTVTFALLAQIGKPELVRGVDKELIDESFHFFNS